jgi:hypothetical protein
MAHSGDLSDEQLRALYAWIDAIPLSRPKRNITRDFSDGVLLAEVVAAYFPHLVELHNYAPANSLKQKVYNFDTLNARVLRKLNFVIPKETVEDIANCKPGVVEHVLNSLQFKMAKYREKKPSSPREDDPSPRTVAPQGGRDRRYEQPPPAATRGAAVSEKGEIRNAPRQSQPLQPQQSKNKASVMASVDEEILLEKEQQIRELQETVEILELKIAKLEQLVRIKDNKIQKLLQQK